MEQTIHHFLYLEKFLVSLIISIPAYNIFISFGTPNSAILSIFSKVHIEFKMKIMRPVFARIINKLIDCLIE